MMTQRKRAPTVSVKVLPGQPLDGSGKVCIHLFVPDERGPFTEPSVVQMVDSDDGRHLVHMATRGRIACDWKRTVALTTVKGVTSVTLRTDDPRAVTCPKCVATAEYAAMMKQLGESNQPIEALQDKKASVLAPTRSGSAIVDRTKTTRLVDSSLDRHLRSVEGE